MGGPYGNLVNTWTHLTKLFKVTVPGDVINQYECGAALISYDVDLIEPLVDRYDLLGVCPGTTARAVKPALLGGRGKGTKDRL